MFFSMILSHVTANLVLHSFSRNVCRSYIYFFEVEVMHTIKMKRLIYLRDNSIRIFLKDIRQLLRIRCSVVISKKCAFAKLKANGSVSLVLISERALIRAIKF